jgi:ribulose-5-phosphate 4-epimerase/fuculose-1-phosphate aldolase
MIDLELKSQVALVARMLVRADLIQGFGHVSARTKGGFFITSTKPLAKTVARDVIFYEFSKNSKKKYKNLPLEISMHAAIYIQRTDVNAICRGHGEFSSIWAVGSAKLPLLHGLGAIAGEIVKNYNDINLINNMGTATKVAKTLGSDVSIILGSNGCLSTGGNLLEAATRLYFLEERSRIAIHTRSAGIKLRKNSKKDWKIRMNHTKAETIRAVNWFENTFSKM